MAVRKGKPIRDVIRGDTRRVSCTFYDEDNTTALNLAGGTVYFTVNSSSDPSTDVGATIQKTATSFTDAANGNHIFTLTHSDTNIAAGDYWYDSSFIDSTGAYTSTYRGTFSVQSDITRS
jgi:hypothetical protein